MAVDSSGLSRASKSPSCLFEEEECSDGSYSHSPLSCSSEELVFVREECVFFLLEVPNQSSNAEGMDGIGGRN